MFKSNKQYRLARANNHSKIKIKQVMMINKLILNHLKDMEEKLSQFQNQYNRFRNLFKFINKQHQYRLKDMAVETMEVMAVVMPAGAVDIEYFF